jgi:hypothetical protein
MRAVPYASRQHLCVNEEVTSVYSGNSLNHACKKVRSNLKDKIPIISSTKSTSDCSGGGCGGGGGGTGTGKENLSMEDKKKKGPVFVKVSDIEDISRMS